MAAKAGETVYLEIVNKTQVAKTFRALTFANPIDKKALRELVKQPIVKMRNKSKENLISQGSVKTGALLGSFSVRSRAYKNEYIAEYGSTSKYNYPVDIGTGDRYTKKGKWTGAVGKATTNYVGRNYSFKLGYANRAINDVLPSIETHLAKGIDTIVQAIIIRNKI